jgi:thymidylate synthase
MNNLDKQYTDLLQDILDNGVTKQDRTGTGTISVFGRQIRHKMSTGFPLLTSKHIKFDLIVTELLWFLRGDTNIKFLVDNNCHIWDGDAYKNYLNVVMYEKPDYLHEKHGHLNMSVEKEGDWYLTLTQEEFINKIKTNDEFAKRWGELGPIYGKQWRKWVGYEQNTKIDGVYSEYAIDQIANLINDLKTNPDSRRLMVNAWNVGELDQMVLPPCHYGFQVYTSEMSNDERCQHWAELIGKDLSYTKNLTNKKLDDLGCPTRKISLSWNQRSVDTFLGLPFNIASYGLLLEIIAKEVNMVPDELIGNLGDTHLYLNHIEQAKEQIGREYTHEERTELLKQAMGEENYNKALDELMPFGGGLSEYYDSYKIPKRTREPFLLPTLNFSNWYKNANDEKQSEIVFNEWIESIKIGDFKVENYQSHSAISAPLSN